MRIGLCYALLSLMLLPWRTAAASSSSPTPEAHWQSETPQVFVEGTRLHYYGRLNETGADRLRAVLADASPDLRTLHIASPGGDGLASIDIGGQIHGRDLTVVVVGEGCASGCANYVFAPARRRVISHESLVLWHYSCPSRISERPGRVARNLRRSFGTPRFGYKAQDENGPIEDPVVLRENFEQNLDRLVEAHLAYGRNVREGHRRIFESTGVDPRVICLTDHLRLPKVPEQYIDFMYTLPVQDMVRFGMCNVDARTDYEAWAGRRIAEDRELRAYAGVVHLADHPRFRPRPTRDCAHTRAATAIHRDHAAR